MRAGKPYVIDPDRARVEWRDNAGRLRRRSGTRAIAASGQSISRSSNRSNA